MRLGRAVLSETDAVLMETFTSFSWSSSFNLIDVRYIGAEAVDAEDEDDDEALGLPLAK